MIEVKHYNQLAINLLRKGMSAGYVKRIVTELSEHRVDIIEGMADSGCSRQESEEIADRNIGNIDHLTNEIVQKMKASSFAGKHPLISFILLPLPALIITLLAAFVTIFLTGNIIKFMGISYYNEPLRTALINAFNLLSLSINSIPFIWFCIIGRKSHCDLKWVGVASLLFAFLGYCLTISMELNAPIIGQNTSSLSLGFTTSQGMLSDNILRLLLPLSTFFLFYIYTAIIKYRSINSYHRNT